MRRLDADATEQRKGVVKRLAEDLARAWQRVVSKVSSDLGLARHKVSVRLRRSTVQATDGEECGVGAAAGVPLASRRGLQRGVLRLDVGTSVSQSEEGEGIYGGGRVSAAEETRTEPAVELSPEELAAAAERVPSQFRA
jgi:hypothetical protein